jgi:hypothetical protein
VVAIGLEHDLVVMASIHHSRITITNGPDSPDSPIRWEIHPVMTLEAVEGG